MPSTINCPTPCSQAPWKHGAHQSPRKACGPKSRRSCLSHLLGRKYTKNLAQTRCSPSCQISMTALNFHSMQSGQNVRKSRENPLYLWQRLSLATSLGLGKPSPCWMRLPGDSTGQGSGTCSRGSDSSWTKSFFTLSTTSYICLSAHHALQRWPL